MAQIIASAIGIGLPTVVIGLLIWRLRQLRHFAYFRVVDEKTKQPLVGAKVFQIKVSQARGYVINDRVQEGMSWSSKKPLGTLDARGEFRGVFGRASGAFLLEGSGIQSGIIGLENVSEYTRHPGEPYECVLQASGQIAPPRKTSPISLGLGVGEVTKERHAFVNQYEKPEIGDGAIAWPTLEDAKANNQNANFARYWEVTGIETGPGYLGNSFSIEVQTVKRVEK